MQYEQGLWLCVLKEYNTRPSIDENCDSVKGSIRYVYMCFVCMQQLGFSVHYCVQDVCLSSHTLDH